MKPYLLSVLGFFIPTLLQSATWVGPSPWNQDNSWSPNTGFPNAIGATATFSGAAQGDVHIGEDIRIGHLIVTGGTYTIGFDPFTFFLNNGGPTGTATIELSGGSTTYQSNSILPVQSLTTFTNTSGNPFILDSVSFFGNILTIAQGEIKVINGADFSVVPNISSSGILTLDTSATSFWSNLNGSGLLNFNNSSAIIFNLGDSVFSGTMTSGSMASLEVQGHLTLSGNNSGYTGSLLVDSGGTLAVSAQENLGPSLLTLDQGTLSIIGNTPFTAFNDIGVTPNGGVFDIGPDTALSLSSPIVDRSPNGTIEKVGAGTLNLGSANTYTGITLVSEGRLNVNGSITSDALVLGGGTLGGTGSIFGSPASVNPAVTISANATIAPGTSIGTLSAASLSLDTDSITLIGINPSAASRIAVAGNAQLGGQVHVNADFGTYPPSGDYTILTAGSFAGSYNPVVVGPPGFNFSLREGSVILHYDFVGINTSGLSGNTLKFAQYLNNHAPYTPELQSLIRLSGSALENGLNSASPARNAFATYVVENTLFALSEIVNSHLLDQRYYHAQRSIQPTVAALFSDAHLTADASEMMMCLRQPDPCDKYSFWAGGFGEYSHQKSQDQNPEFHFTSGGALLGFDYYGRGNNLFGFSGGYAYTHLIEDHNAGHAKINYYLANLYDTVYSQNWYLELALWGAYNQAHNYRHISFPGFDATASATIKSWQLVPHLGFGYNAQYCWGAIEPFAQFDCAISWQQSFREHGAGAFDMTQESNTSEFLRSEAGFRFYESRETAWGAWMVMEKISYVNKKTFGTGQVSAAIVGTSALFSVESFRGVQNLGSAGLEFLWRFGCVKPVTLSIAYNGEFGSKYMSHEGMIRVMKDF